MKEGEKGYKRRKKSEREGRKERISRSKARKVRCQMYLYKNIE